MPKPYKAPELWHFFAAMAVVGATVLGVAVALEGLPRLLWAVMP